MVSLTSADLAWKETAQQIESVIEPFVRLDWNDPAIRAAIIGAITGRLARERTRLSQPPSSQKR